MERVRERNRETDYDESMNKETDYDDGVRTCI